MSNRKLFSQNSINLLLFGIIIGIASITPGLSGGILAIALGVYAPALSAVQSLRRDFKNSLTFLLPLGLGALLGLFLFGLLMKPLLLRFAESVICLFTGLIIGSLPSVLREANSKGFRPVYLIPLFLSFLIGYFSANAAESAVASLKTSPFLYGIGGGIFALGLIVPGISSSFLLIEMGLYTDILSAFTTLNLSVLIPTAIGILLFLALFLRIINLAFSKWHGYAYYTAIGFLISSVFTVFPGFHTFLDAFLLLLGAITVYLFMHHSRTIS